ncbi:MAG: PD40 domain-containing protein [Holophagales bacterium]|nr:PD40 domain-containing protein [Holophagales bacterium]
MAAEHVSGSSWSPRRKVDPAFLEPRREPRHLPHDPGGLEPRRLTFSLAHDTHPTWSRDGAWIYFSSNREDSRQVWRMTPDADAVPVRVTSCGDAWGAYESADGRSLYVVRQRGRDAWSVWKMPVDGGEGDRDRDRSRLALVRRRDGDRHLLPHVGAPGRPAPVSPLRGRKRHAPPHAREEVRLRPSGLPRRQLRPLHDLRRGHDRADVRREVPVTGERLSHYELLERPARGHGRRYQARDAWLGRFVAVKVLLPGKASTPSAASGFVQEAKAASGL